MKLNSTDETAVGTLNNAGILYGGETHDNIVHFQQQKLTPSDAADLDSFGYATDMSADGR